MSKETYFDVIVARLYTHIMYTYICISLTSKIKTNEVSGHDVREKLPETLEVYFDASRATSKF